MSRTHGTMIINPKKPYTTDGIPANSSTPGFIMRYNGLGQNLAKNTAAKIPIGTPTNDRSCCNIDTSDDHWKDSKQAISCLPGAPQQKFAEANLCHSGNTICKQEDTDSSNCQYRDTGTEHKDKLHPFFLLLFVVSYQSSFLSQPTSLWSAACTHCLCAGIPVRIPYFTSAQSVVVPV